MGLKVTLPHVTISGPARYIHPSSSWGVESVSLWIGIGSTAFRPYPVGVGWPQSCLLPYSPLLIPPVPKLVPYNQSISLTLLFGTFVRFVRSRLLRSRQWPIRFRHRFIVEAAMNRRLPTKGVGLLWLGVSILYRTLGGYHRERLIVLYIVKGPLR